MKKYICKKFKLYNPFFLWYRRTMYKIVMKVLLTILNSDYLDGQVTAIGTKNNLMQFQWDDYTEEQFLLKKKSKEA